MTITAHCTMCGEVHASSDLEVVEFDNHERLICKVCQEKCENLVVQYCEELGFYDDSSGTWL